MFSLTPYERKVLLCIGLLILGGGALRFSHVRLQEPVPQEIVTRPPHININTASAQELTVLPGIGPAIASRIIEYRKCYGGFHTLEDVQKVKGIGPKKAEAIRGYVSF